MLTVASMPAACCHHGLLTNFLFDALQLQKATGILLILCLDDIFWMQSTDFVVGLYSFLFCVAWNMFNPVRCLHKTASTIELHLADVIELKCNSVFISTVLDIVIIGSVWFLFNSACLKRMSAVFDCAHCRILLFLICLLHS